MPNNHPKSICPKCGDLIANCAMKRHLNSCTGKIKSKVYQPIHTYDIGPTPCSFCGRICKNGNSLVQHEIRCPKNPNRKDYDKLSQYAIHNFKGQTKETNETIAKAAASLKQAYADGSIQCSLPFISSNPDYTYQSDIDAEIFKWHQFISSQNLILPKFDVSTRSDGYQYTCTIDGKSRNEFRTKYILVHVLILESLLHRHLDDSETVHHIDEDKSNNSLYNLLIFKTRGDHARFHLKRSVRLIYDPICHNFSSI